MTNSICTSIKRSSSPLQLLKDAGFKLQAGSTATIELKQGISIAVECLSLDSIIQIYTKTDGAWNQVDAHIQGSMDGWIYSCNACTGGVNAGKSNMDKLDNNIRRANCLGLVLALCKEILCSTEELAAYRKQVVKAKRAARSNKDISVDTGVSVFDRDYNEIDKPTAESILSAMESTGLGSTGVTQVVYRAGESSFDKKRGAIYSFPVSLSVRSGGSKHWAFDGYRISKRDLTSKLLNMRTLNAGQQLSH